MRIKRIFVTALCVATCAMIALGGCNSDGSGNGGSSGGDTLTKSWHHPASITDYISFNGQYASFPQVAMSDNGEAIIVWQQSDGTNLRIFKSEYRNGVWKHPVNLDDHISPGGQDAYEPKVAMDGNGNAVIVWYQSDGTNYRIYKSDYRGRIWTHPANLSNHISPAGGPAVHPIVAMNRKGNAIIAWNQSEVTANSRAHVYKSEYRDGFWIHPTSISDYISPNAGPPSVSGAAMDNDGNIIIVWSQFETDDDWNPGEMHIFKSEYRRGVWAHPVNYSDHLNPNGGVVGAVGPSVAMDNKGNAIIIWNQYCNSSSSVFKSEYRSGTWIHPTSITDNISPDVGSARDHAVAMDNNGNIVIVWSQSLYEIGITGSRVFKSEYRNGVWKHPTSVMDYIGPNVGLANGGVGVAMCDNGHVVIVWSQSLRPYNDPASEEYQDYRVFKSEYLNGAWKHPVSYSDHIGANFGEAIFPFVAMDSAGEAIIVWQQSVGPEKDYLSYQSYQIFKSEYR